MADRERVVAEKSHSHGEAEAVEGAAAIDFLTHGEFARMLGLWDVSALDQLTRRRN